MCQANGIIDEDIKGPEGFCTGVVASAAWVGGSWDGWPCRCGQGVWNSVGLGFGIGEGVESVGWRSPPLGRLVGEVHGRFGGSAKVWGGFGPSHREKQGKGNQGFGVGERRKHDAEFGYVGGV